MKSMLRRRLSKAPAYARRFGPLNGLRLLLQIERGVPRTSQHVKAYRLPGYPAPICLRHCISDHATFWQCLVMCQYDFRGFPQFERFLKAYRSAIEKGERPLIIDCGANIGLASVWFAVHFPDAQIYAIEPDPANLAMLRRNVAPFGDRVAAIPGGIWHEETLLRIVNPEAGSAAFRVSGSVGDSTVAIPAYTTDQICAMAGTETPFIVKIDVEGAQASLFNEHAEWVRRTHLVTLELDDWQFPWQGTSRPFFSQISRYPFEYLLGGESIFCFRDLEADAQ